MGKATFSKTALEHVHEARKARLNVGAHPRRLGCDMLPWMGTASKPSARSSSARRRVDSQVRVKIMAVQPASSFSTNAV